MLLISLLFSFHSNAFTGAEITTLVNIASQVSSTTSNTFKILELAKEQREQFDRVHNSTMRRYYLAEKIKRNAEYIKQVSVRDTYTHKELNSKLSDLKGSLIDTRNTKDRLLRETIRADRYLESSRDSREDIRKDLNESMSEVVESAKDGSTASFNQKSAVSSANTNLLLNKMREENRRFQETIVRLETEKIRQKEAERIATLKWLGCSVEPPNKSDCGTSRL